MQTIRQYIQEMISILSALFCPDGEIGRHNGLKIRCPLGRAGSSPAPGTFNREDNMKEFLNSKKMSLVCAILNVIFALSAFWQGSFIWGVLCMCLGGYCYSNYLND